MLAAVRVWPAGQIGEHLRFVVPDAPDVTIKTRRTFDQPDSTIVSDVGAIRLPILTIVS